MKKQELLEHVRFGSRVAEEEARLLKNYFVQTREWERVYSGEVDIVYGPKGSGKSAICALLGAKARDLLDIYVLYVSAEKPEGTTVFRELEIDPPVSEREFQELWKLYICSLVSGAFHDQGVKNDSAKELSKALKERGVLSGKETLIDKFSSVFNYVKKYVRGTYVEPGVSFDPVTGLASGFSVKVGLDTTGPGVLARGSGLDSLLRLANDALTQSGFKVWISVDRLDVAFKDNEILEANALRALFNVYKDILEYNNIRLVLFLRTDIWKRITQAGFREASHITKTLTITWSKDALLNLTMRRLLHSHAIIEAYRVDLEMVLSDITSQYNLFYKIFPKSVEFGPRPRPTFDWILDRMRDGTGHWAPRELIHFFNESREIQLREFRIGGVYPIDENLFTKSALTEALKPVSRTRLEQTLYAEYPNLKPHIEKLEREKTIQRIETLSRVWSCSQSEAEKIADKLSEIGFFEKTGTKGSPVYRIPFLYGDALGLLQGEAE